MSAPSPGEETWGITVTVLKHLELLCRDGSHLVREASERELGREWSDGEGGLGGMQEIKATLTGITGITL